MLCKCQNLKKGDFYLEQAYFCLKKLGKYGKMCF